MIIIGNRNNGMVLGAVLAASTATAPVMAEEFRLDPVLVEGSLAHPSQQIRGAVDEAFDSSRSSSYVPGAVIQNLNPVNKGDALRYNATGLINQPEGGDRFGGGTKIRTFGDWGASESIDGLPAFKSAGEEGGGYGNTVIPSIAIERLGVLKGGRAVGYGDGTDGGVVETVIKSGRGYKDHAAVSVDASTARELFTQAEAADSGESWDYYVAGNWLEAAYNGDPENLEGQRVLGGLAKVGLNAGEDTRFELLGIVDRSRPDIYRNGALNEIMVDTTIVAMTADHRFTGWNSLRVGILSTDTRSQWPARSRDRSIDNAIAFAEHYVTATVADGVAYDGSVGIEYKHTDYLRDGAWDAEFDDASVKTRNALTFGGNLTVTGGLRYTRFGNGIVLNGVEQPDTLKDDGVWSYEAGASYGILENTRLRASVATGYNRFFEKYGNFGTMALNTAGDGDDIVQSRTLEVGLRQGWTGGWFDAALYNIVQEGVPRQRNGAIESVEVDQTGLELEVAAEVTSQVSVSAGYMRVIDLTTTGADGRTLNGSIYWDGQATSVPENQFNARVTYRPTEDWTLWAAAYHSTGYEAVNQSGAVVERDGFTPGPRRRLLDHGERRGEARPRLLGRHRLCLLMPPRYAARARRNSTRGCAGSTSGSRSRWRCPSCWRA